VAVDLLLEDGSRLSEHDPVDQYGTPATAAGIGAGAILHPDQWNDVQVDLTALAGRTVVEALLVLEAPADPEVDLLDGIEDALRGAPALTGWIDGPRLGPRPADPPPSDPVAWVDTRRGTHSSAEHSRGSTLPLTAMPNGFALFTPATDPRPRPW